MILAARMCVLLKALTPLFARFVLVERNSSSSGNGEWVERENGQVPSARKSTVVDVYKPSEDGWETFKSLLRNKTAMLLFLQGLPGCLPWGLVYVFLNDYLSNDRGLR